VAEYHKKNAFLFERASHSKAISKLRKTLLEIHFRCPNSSPHFVAICSITRAQTSIWFIKKSQKPRQSQLNKRKTRKTTGFPMPGIFAWPANSAENIFNLIKQKQKAEKCCFEQTFYVLIGGD